MKKIIAFSVAVAAAIGAYAMTPSEAFTALSNVPNVSIKADYQPSTIRIDSRTYKSGEMLIAGASGLDQQQIAESANAVYTILNQVPLTHMINGANNNQVAAFLYASPTENGTYEFLVTTMNGSGGDISIMYLTVDQATKDAFENAKVTMQGDRLSITPDPESGGQTFDIKINAGE